MHGNSISQHPLRGSMLPPPPPPPPPPFAAYPFGQPSQILASSGAGTTGPGGPLTPRGAGPPPPSPGAAAATAAALAAAAAAAGQYGYPPIIYWPYPSPPVSPTSYYAGPTGLPPHPAHGGAPTLCILEYP
ncbi:hypothetical protein J437_LFUL004649 [Ladona fulva]|uniref:Uncharacterized protein n=1 Tax=Ladona fulva TaxID=123851 RepID=A0A8K0K338_LADFU|nr:hypothetical protein J437_LFUL004649 [Ladona fulva]